MNIRSLHGAASTVAFAIILVMWLWAMMAWPGEAMAKSGQPLAYVTGSNGISVIDTGDNTVVDTISCCNLAAVSPDGKHVYAFGPSTSDQVFNILVINTAKDKVVATIPLRVSRVPTGLSLNNNSSAITISPDGTQISATTGLCSSISFDCIRPESVYYASWGIDAITNKVVGASPGKGIVDGIAFAPDGKNACVTNFDPYLSNPSVSCSSFSTPLPGFGAVSAIAITPNGRRAYVPYVEYDTSSSNVSIIDTATGQIVKTITIGTSSDFIVPTGVAVTPNGRHVYVTDQENNSVAVIDTVNNVVTETVLTGIGPTGVAVTPDGKHAYVTNQGSNSVSVIDTASQKVVATIPVPSPSAIAIIPPPQGVPFVSLNATLDIDLSRTAQGNSFALETSFTLSSTASNGIHPDIEPIRLQVGPFITTIPAGSFKLQTNGSYTYAGVIDGVSLAAKIEPTGTLQYAFQADAKGASLSGTTNPVQISLSIGDDAGLTRVMAHFHHNAQAYNSH